jgi:hypothetical protein
MKLAVRIFALSVVVAGAAAASVSSPSRSVVNHQSASSLLPIPGCGPHIPTCTPPPPDGQ